MLVNTKRENFKKIFLKQLKKNYFFYLLVIPGVVALILFSYIPMAGIYMAFENYSYKGGIFGSEFVGLRNFKIFFGNRNTAFRAVRNTMVINFGSLIIGMIVNVATAIALNEILNERFRKVTQSLILFPYFLSWIVIGAISGAFLSKQGGALNKIIEMFGGEAISWYTKSQYWWAILIFVSVWKGFGYGSVVYYATITGFDPGLYEAAMVDGASRWKRIWLITIPLLRPTMFLMFLLNVGNILGGSLEFIMGMTKLQGGLLETTDTVATLVYRLTMVDANYGSSAAASLLQSVVGCVFVLTSNLIAKKIDPEYALF